MWVKIRNFLVPMVLNDVALRGICGVAGLSDDKARIVASAVMNIKYFIDTKDKRYVNQSIDELQKLIK